MHVKLLRTNVRTVEHVLMLILLVLELHVAVPVVSLDLDVRLPSLNAVTMELTHQTHVSMVGVVWN